MPDMAITRAGQQDHGADFADLAGYVRGYEAGGYPVAQVSELVCRECRGTVFRVLVDDDDEGCAVAVCQGCEADSDIADSAEYFADAERGVYTDWKIDYGPTAHLLSRHPS